MIDRFIDFFDPKNTKGAAKDLDFPKHPTPPTREEIRSILNGVEYFDQHGLLTQEDGFEVLAEVLKAARIHYPDALADEQRMIRRRKFLKNALGYGLGIAWFGGFGGWLLISKAQKDAYNNSEAYKAEQRQEKLNFESKYLLAQGSTTRSYNGFRLSIVNLDPKIKFVERINPINGKVMTSNFGTKRDIIFKHDTQIISTALQLEPFISTDGKYLLQVDVYNVSNDHSAFSPWLLKPNYDTPDSVIVKLEGKTEQESYYLKIRSSDQTKDQSNFEVTLMNLDKA